MPTLRVRVISANNLPRMDTFSQSDAYCQLRCGGQFFQTQVFKRSNNPQWNAEFSFNLMNPMAESLQISVWDKDRFSRDDQIGYAMFPLGQLYVGRPTPQTMPLQGGKGGTVTVELTALDFGIGMPGMQQPYGAPVPPMMGPSYYPPNPYQQPNPYHQPPMMPPQNPYQQPYGYPHAYPGTGYHPPGYY